MGQKLENFITSYTDFIIKFRIFAILLALAGVVSAGYGMKNLGFSTNYRAFFSKANPELNTFEDFQNIYTKNDNILFVIQPKDGKVFKQNITALLEEMTEQAWKIPYASRVDSLTNFQNSYAEEDDLIVEDLISDSHNLSDEDMAQKQKIAMNELLLRQRLIADDGEATGINITLQYPEKTITEVPTAVAEARKIVEYARAKNPDLIIGLTGVSMMNNAFSESGMKDMGTLMPLMYLMILIVMIVMLRSFGGTIATLFIIMSSIITAMGLAGHAGILLTPITMSAPTIILTLAVADSVHILITMIKLMAEGQDKKTALKESMRINFVPITITSLTTIIGFAVLNFSDSPPFNDLGNITAVGIFAAWLYSITLLPALMSILPIKVRKVSDGKNRMANFLSAYSRFIVKRRKPVLAVMSAIAIGLTALVPMLELNDQWVKYFDNSIEFRRDADFGIRELTGVYPIEFSIEAKESGGISEPLYLQKLDEFTEWMRTQPEVEHVFSYTDIVKRLNRNMHGDNPEWYKIPESRGLAAQYLLLYEMSLTYGLDLNDRINIDKSATRVTATLGDMTTLQTRAFLEHAEAWLEENAPEYMHAKATGATVMFTFISSRNIHQMLTGNVLAIALISIVMIIALRSFGIGILSIIPNSVPILVTFGIWTLTFGQIGMASAIVSAVALGIVVDDTVHFLSKYLRARREKNMSKEEALEYAFQTVGVALIVTTIILTLGFLIMALSSFEPNKQLGLMTSTNMVMALVFDFTLLPALLLIGTKKAPKKLKTTA
ncbi:MAG: efflux RND transporter permease subunit [Alphaproteobacteria bacterium]